jgi:hypothetical protein
MSNIDEQIEKIKKECFVLTELLPFGKIKVEYNRNKKQQNETGKILISNCFASWDS